MIFLDKVRIKISHTSKFKQIYMRKPIVLSNQVNSIIKIKEGKINTQKWGATKIFQYFDVAFYQLLKIQNEYIIVFRNPKKIR